jgi:acyl carrier protein
MEKSKIIEISTKFLVDEFEVDGSTISPEAPLKETLGLDSLDYVDLVVVIEENFGVKLKEQDFMKISNFDDFYNVIEEKIKEK